jgi:hypothetical protein
MGAYEDGYEAGSTGQVGACLADESQQSDYDRGFDDGGAGRPPSPDPPLTIPSDPVTPSYQSSDPDAEPPPTMGPSDGTTGSGPAEPPEWPEYDMPPETYQPDVEAD